jgi:hypothetical protein
MNAEKMMQAGDAIVLDESKQGDFELKLMEYRERFQRGENREQSKAKFATLDRLLHLGIISPVNIDEIALRATADLAAAEGKPTAVVQALIFERIETLLGAELQEQTERLHRIKRHVADAIEVLRAYNDGNVLLLKGGTGFGGEKSTN